MVFHGAENRGRTDTMSPSRDFKSLASAYSAIPACLFEFALLSWMVIPFNSTMIISQGFFFVKQFCDLCPATFVGASLLQKKSTSIEVLFFLEASPRLELGMRILQTLALPLGYDAIILERVSWMTFVIHGSLMERETGFGPATFTLAR